MAEVQQGGGGGKGKHQSGPKQKKKSTRVDMTAMVDVAFLLLTFFILTTTMQKQKGTELVLPAKDKEHNQDATDKVAADKVMTVILGDNNKIYWYIGAKDTALTTVDYTEKGIRKTLMDFLEKGPREKNMPRCKSGGSTVGCWDPIFVIKPARTCNYENVVDILDELKIVGAKKHALTDVSPSDSLMMANQHKK